MENLSSWSRRGDLSSNFEFSSLSSCSISDSVICLSRESIVWLDEPKGKLPVLSTHGDLLFANTDVSFQESFLKPTFRRRVEIKGNC